jgi:L-ascorbate metabolism protein UlaG (beta-lactamase superfamily)
MKTFFIFSLALFIPFFGCDKDKNNPAIEIGSSVTNVTKYHGTDGAIDVTVSGGQSPYTYYWSDGNTGEDRTNLAAGEYSLTLTDADGETVNSTYVVECPISIEPSVLSQYIKGYAQSSIRINDNGTIIYFDPFASDENGDADIIFTSHNHGDHIGSNALCNANTVFVSPENAKNSYASTTDANFHLAVEGGEFTIGNISIKVVPAYNSWHPRGDAMAVGYVVTLSNGVIVYHTGDTGLIPEMSNIDCDVVFTPLGQTYTFASVADAATAVENCKAEVAIPIHYGMYEGTAGDVVTLTNLLAPKNIKLLDLPRN